MNKTRLTEIARWLEAGAPVRNGVIAFNMENGVARRRNACGTACCIAGAAVMFFDPEARDHIEKNIQKRLDQINVVFRRSTDYAIYDFFSPGGVKVKAQHLLEIDSDQGDALFVPFDGEGLDDIQPVDAARVIRHFIKTGEIDWVGQNPHLARTGEF